MNLALLTKNAENLGNDILDMQHALTMERLEKEDLKRKLENAETQIIELHNNKDFEREKSSRKVEALQSSNLDLHMKIDQLEVELVNYKNQHQKLILELENAKADHKKELELRMSTHLVSEETDIYETEFCEFSQQKVSILCYFNI